MKGISAPGAILVALLIVSLPFATASRGEQSAILPYQLVLSPGYYQPIQVDAPSTPTTVSISVSSNTSLSTALMSTSQFTSFDNGMSDISSSVFLQNGSSVQHSVSVPKGVYYVVFYAYGSTANVSYNFQTDPISPFVTVPLTPPESSGVAAFGLYNDSGQVTAYTTKSSDVIGVAQIAAIQAYNGTAAQFNDTVSGATLQLNTILVVNEKGGLQQFYWAQNTPDFVTSTNQVSWADNVWNSSVSGFLSNSTITSTDGGYAYSFYNYGSPGYYYSFQSSNSTYVLPFQLALVISETTIAGQGVLVQMGEQVIGNGSAPSQAINWFDHAMIHDPTVQSAYFYVSGNDTVPNGLFYDTEFVFGGEGNGESTTFTQLTASLGLFYGDSPTGPQTAFPSYYSFGGNTGEATYNLHVSSTGNGFSMVSVGAPNYGYLGRVSGTYALPQAGTTVTMSFSAQTSSTSQTASSGGTLSLGTYLIAGGAIAALIVIVFAVVMRERGNRRTIPESPYPMQPVSRLCGRCGAQVDPDTKFCPNCGAQLLADWPGPSGT